MAKQQPRNAWQNVKSIAVIVAVFVIWGISQLQNHPSSSPTSNMQTAQAPSDKEENTVRHKKIPVTFKRVVDGDTIVIMMEGKEARVRYLMVDTPESVKEGLKPQPFGKESSKRNHEILSKATQVYVMFDNGPRTDDYDRLLAYVYADDVLVPEQLLREGLASVSYVKPPNNSFEKAFRKAQSEAKKQKLNIWSIDGYVNEKGKFNHQ